MSDNPTKLQRWLDLIAYLGNRRFPVPIRDVWAHVPAYAPGLEADKRDHARVRRMFERDKDELRELGIPIETVELGGAGRPQDEAIGYQLARKDFHLPYLKLVRESRGEPDAPDRPTPPAAFEIREREASAALEGLRHLGSLPAFPLAAEARSAFRKLAFDLDADLLDDDPVLHVEDPETRASAAALKALSAALLARKATRFGYRSIGRDADAERTVRPYGLFFQHGRWYLVGHDEDRGEIRVFRVGRMRDVVANTRSPGTRDYRIPEDFRLDAYTGRSAWELGADDEPVLEATVRFAFPRSLWAERNGHGRLVEELDDGAQLRRFEVRRRDPFLRWLLSLTGDASVEEPKELGDALRDMALQVTARHA